MKDWYALTPIYNPSGYVHLLTGAWTLRIVLVAKTADYVVALGENGAESCGDLSDDTAL